MNQLLICRTFAEKRGKIIQTFGLYCLDEMLFWAALVQCASRTGTNRSKRSKNSGLENTENVNVEAIPKSADNMLHTVHSSNQPVVW